MANSRGWLKRQQTKGDGTMSVDDGEVARVAYELYEQRGREEGHALDDWLKAEGLVKQRRRHTNPIIV
ncbi:MAG: DUF2934 domain-containing protein [Candidatus Omnitrophica bacterium]|nr:DUF2934 domain-containing protein [Candidatus Omnitrophota bacterium]